MDPSWTPHGPLMDPSWTPHGPSWTPRGPYFLKSKTINRRASVTFSSFVFRRCCVNMPYKHRRKCPICCKPDLLYLSDHLSQVHGLTSEERKQWLKSAVFFRYQITCVTFFTAVPVLVNALHSHEYEFFVATTSKNTNETARKYTHESSKV